jgi:sensor histidine kinase regulating citrate/malate metabolism
VEKQDLDEMVGNLIENASKYGGGRVFVTVRTTPECVEIEVEDDGQGIRRHCAPASSIAVPGSTRKSPAPASASRSYGTWRKSTAARSRWKRAKILGGLLARLKLPLCKA